MTPLERSYRLLMLAFPAEYRRERQEEMISTLLDTADATRTRPTLREALDLLTAAAHVRWRFSTGGSLRATWAQGLRWGAIGWLAYVAARMVVTAVARARFGLDPSLLLAPLWLGSLLLTATGVHRWAIGSLAAAIVAQAFVGIDQAARYGGASNWAFALTFFVPMSVPLLPLFLPQPRPVCYQRRNVIAVLLALAALATLVATIAPHHGPHLPLTIAILGIAVGWFDPRLAVAAGLLVINGTMFQVLNDIEHGLPQVSSLFGQVLFFMLAAGASYNAKRAVRI
jgi:hypothetical protein